MTDTSKQITLQDIVFGLMTLIVGFFLITFVPKDIPHPGIYMTIAAGFGLLGPVLFIVKFFRTRLKPNEDTKEELKK